MKTCLKCRVEKEQSEFYKTKSKCKKCILNQIKLKRDIKKPRSTNPNADRICARCNELKPSTDYYNIQYAKCKKCHSQTVMDHERKNRRTYGSYRKQYELLHPDKVQEWRKKTDETFISKTGMSYGQYSYMKLKERMKENPELVAYILNRTKEYYHKNKKLLSEKQKQYYQQNKEAFRIYELLKKLKRQDGI